MLLYSCDGGLDVCVDVKGSSPLTPGMIDFVSGRAVIKVAQFKRAKYDAKCVDIGYGFFHFPFSSFRELEKDSVTLLKRFRKFSVIQDIKEVDIRLSGGCDKPLRLANMLLYSWDEGLYVCVDLTGSLPLTQTEMVDFVLSRAVIDAAHSKRVKYEAKRANIGYGFLPFSFSLLGELEKDVVTLLKWIQKFSVTQDIGARVAVYVFDRISFAIAKGAEAQLVSRLSTNFLKIFYFL
uniref:Auxilin-like protein n=1 Tax=Tanacetum cinerariifolium TaxID=118510 RepID=A0A699HAM0_TANCI|nr:hypothetical protein [Tanacetum cinerariifolium]